MIKNARYEDFFPYPAYRSSQEKIIAAIEGGMRNRKNILLVAPNGTGKTIMALSGVLSVALEKDLKVVFTCRTHAQGSRVMKELEKIILSTPAHVSISGISLRGRNEMCLNESLLKMRITPSDAMATCNEFRKNGRCQYYRNHVKLKEDWEDYKEKYLKRALDGEELLEECKEEKLCPYFLAKLLLKEMDVIVCNYQWVYNPEIRFGFLNLLDSKLDNVILINDECHNLVNVATEMNSKRLHPSLLKSCFSDAQSLLFPRSFISFIEFLLSEFDKKKRSLKKEDETLDGKTYTNYIVKKIKAGGIKKFTQFLTTIEGLNKTVREQSSSTGTKDNIKNLIAFWKKWLKAYKNEKYFLCYHVERYQKRKEIFLEIVSLDAREITVPIFKRTFSSVNMSGTVNPWVYNKLTGLNYRYEGKGFKSITVKSPFPKKNVFACIVKGVSTKNEDRNPKMFDKINEKITEVVHATPGNTGVFCASYSLLNSLKMNGLQASLRQTGRQLFFEQQGTSSHQNALMLKKYKQASNHNGGVLVGVSGGRNSEGEDFPGKFMDSVVIVGIPYHRPTLRVKAKIAYYDKAFKGQGWNFGYLNSAMERSNQASGRPIRKMDDKGSIIFLDERFIQRKAWICEWMRDLIEIIPDKKNTLSRKLLRFWM